MIVEHLIGGGEGGFPAAIGVEHLKGEGGGASGMISSSPLPLVYHLNMNSRISHRGGGGSGGMISSSP